MVLSIPFQGSGEFVPVRVWSCPVHDDDRLHWQDEDDEDRAHGESCLDCWAGVWRDEKDVDGNVVMRELSVWEAGFRRAWEADGALNAVATFALKPETKVAWLEDQVMPIITANGD